ncbi:MAG: PAS domain-containing sensor histidine kinase, partial [Opitutae bacterium]|nr:PAS domain-containing sensor histidine kinase [Opitutae bacterium]
ITEQKNHEKELTEINERFMQLEKNSRTIAWEVDPDGRYTYVSPVVQSVLGYAPGDLVGHLHFFDLHPAEGREEFRRQTLEVFARRAPFRNLMNPAVTRDGRRVWFSTDGLPMLDADGHLRGYRGSDQDITERKRAEEEVRQMSLRMRELTRHVQSVREEEKRRIAVWLHDEIGQMLTRARMDAMLLEQDPVPSSVEAATALASLKRTLDQAVKTIRHISTDLRPAILDDFGLVAVLEWAVHEDEKRLKIPFHLKIDRVPDFLDPGLSVAFYRIARECLTNIARHAAATAVEIRLSCDGQSLTLVVQDNGRGLPPGAADSPTSFGLGQMRERASALDGEVRIESRPGEGTTVVATAPLRRPGQPENAP